MNIENLKEKLADIDVDTFALSAWAYKEFLGEERFMIRRSLQHSMG